MLLYTFVARVGIPSHISSKTTIYIEILAFQRGKMTTYGSLEEERKTEYSY